MNDQRLQNITSDCGLASCPEKRASARGLFLRTSLAAFVVAGAFCSGCGRHDLHPAFGKIVSRDGTPLNGMRVVFENQASRTSSVAITDDEGRFELGTLNIGDGALLGTYQVAVVDAVAQRKMDRSALRIHPKYQDLKTSHLEFEVTKDKHEFELVLDPP